MLDVFGLLLLLLLLKHGIKVLILDVFRRSGLYLILVGHVSESAVDPPNLYLSTGYTYKKRRNLLLGVLVVWLVWWCVCGGGS